LITWRGRTPVIRWSSFSQVLSNLIVRDGEMVCVELVAADKNSTRKIALFCGTIHYEKLKLVYDARPSVAAKGKKKGLFPGQERMEFVRMRGPAGKGCAEMAVSKVKGASVETPSSEPGFSIADTDSWEELEDGPYSRRRMSDPSSSLKGKVRGWQTRRLNKSKSDNQGLDCPQGVSEIDAADVRDELDDASNKRLWTLPGFSQAYHCWKEKKRNNSLPLHSFLTYLTLPWHHIIAGLINSKQPLLNF